MILASFNRPTIFAHRGSSIYAPENTMAAFDLALQHGADAIELDVKLTADNHVVIIHDQTLERTTGQPGDVRKCSLEEIRRLDAGSYFDVSFKGERIPTLAELFEKIGGRASYNIELTNYASPTDPLPEKVANLVERYNLAERILFSSFNPLALIRARRKLRQVPIGLLALPGKSGDWARSWPGMLLRYQALHIEKSDATAKVVASTHQRHHRIHVYTVNEGAEMKALFNLGVDGIFTDDPPLARQILATFHSETSSL
jgi:glycerophosphoryl diester phosphodiesterase